MTGPRKILVAGYYGAKNAGDEAILAGLLACFRAAGFAGDFTVITRDPADTRALHGVEGVAWNHIEAVIDAAQQADLVVVGGGGLFHDYWGVDPSTVLTSRQGGIAQYATPVYLAAMLGRPCALLGVGVGPLRTDLGRDLTRAVFELADLAYVRDQGSLDLVRTIGVSVEHVKLGRDLAFAAPWLDLPPAVISLLSSLPRPILGVALRYWTFGAAGGSWEVEIAEAIDRWQETTGGTALFVPMQTGSSEIEDDVAVARRMIARLREPVSAVLLPDGLSPLERFSSFGACDLVLGMRMHSLVAALRADVRALGLAYDPKLIEVAAHSGQGRATAMDLGSGASDLAEALLALTAGVPDLHRHPIEDDLTSNSSRSAAAILRLAAESEASRREKGTLEAVAELLRQRAEWSALLDKAEHELGRRDRLVEEARQQAASARREAEAERESLAEALQASRSRQQSLVDALHASLNEQESLRGENLEWANQAESLRLESANLTRQVGDLEQQKSALEGQLGELRSTIGVRLLARYWALARRLAPPGSRPRRWYGRIRAALVDARIAPRPLSGEPSYEASTADQIDRALGDFLHRWRFSKRVFLLISPVALRLSEGQRATHLALELAGRGHPVVFAYWRWSHEEPVDPAPDLVFQLPLDELARRPRSILDRFSDANVTLLLEFPYPKMFETLAFARGRGWKMVYDVVDNWAEFHRVGLAEWYDPDFEAHLVFNADRVIAVNQRLADRLHALGRQGVNLVPNGARAGIDRIIEPVDLPRGEITLGYFGYLSEAWFDWDLIAQVAQEQPTWRIYLIGYGGNGHHRLPDNVVLLGRVDPLRLSAHAAHWDVGIIPFKPSTLAADADPIKAYEYLAMGLPVVSTGCPAPMGAEALVLLADGAADFIRQVRRAAKETGMAAARRAFAARCSWRERADLLLGSLESAPSIEPG